MRYRLRTLMIVCCTLVGCNANQAPPVPTPAATLPDLVVHANDLLETPDRLEPNLERLQGKWTVQKGADVLTLTFGISPSGQPSKVANGYFDFELKSEGHSLGGYEQVVFDSANKKMILYHPDNYDLMTYKPRSGAQPSGTA